MALGNMEDESLRKVMDFKRRIFPMEETRTNDSGCQAMSLSEQTGCSQTSQSENQRPQLDTPTTSKMPFTSDLHHHLGQRILRVSPGYGILQGKIMDYQATSSTNIECSRRERYHVQLLTRRIQNHQRYCKEYLQNRKEMQPQVINGPKRFTTPSSFGRLESSSFQIENLKWARLQARQRHLLHMLEKIKEKNASLNIITGKALKFIKEKDESSKHLVKVVPREQKEQIDEMALQLNEFGKKLHSMKKILEETGVLTVVPRSISHDDSIEQRRHDRRKEVSACRMYSKMKAANSNRGLVVNKDSLGDSESDRTFNLSSLNEALPTVSNRRGAPRTRRNINLFDLVLKDMEEKRLFREEKRLLRQVTAELGSMDITTQKEKED